jgi:hypothetical protein
MRLTTVVRAGTLAAMAASLVLGFFGPGFFTAARTTLLWLIPAWIAVLFLVQTLTTPNASGTTPLEAAWNRLRGRTWTCPRCGRRHLLHVPLCGECGELRPLDAQRG